MYNKYDGSKKLCSEDSVSLTSGKHRLRHIELLRSFGATTMRKGRVQYARRNEKIKEDTALDHCVESVENPKKRKTFEEFIGRYRKLRTDNAARHTGNFMTECEFTFQEN